MRCLGYLQHLSSSLYAIYSEVIKIAVRGSFHCVGHHKAVYLLFPQAFRVPHNARLPEK